MSAETNHSFIDRRDALKIFVGAGVSVALTGCGLGKEGGETNTPPPSQSPAKSPENETPPRSGEFSMQPSWEQDFTRMQNGPVDTAVWRHELNPEVPTYNNEKQAYTDREKNIRIQDGQLVIEAHREPYHYSGESKKYRFTSGHIDTKQSHSFEFGKMEATMKLPEGEGTWPAFWFLSANQVRTSALHPTDSDWEQERFYLHDGELDGMEAYGNKPGLVEATLHTFATSKERQIHVPDGTSAFHTYGVEVTPDNVTWTLDGKSYFSIDKPSDNPNQWPFGNNNKFYTILNLAMGGEGGGEIDPQLQQARLEVKSLKFYEYTGK